jgi:hypothetical protein
MNLVFVSQRGLKPKSAELSTEPLYAGRMVMHTSMLLGSGVFRTHRTHTCRYANVLEDAVRQVYGPRRSVIVYGLKT